MTKADNKYTNMPQVAARPFKRCMECGRSMSPSEGACECQAMANKGMTAPAEQKPNM